MSKSVLHEPLARFGDVKDRRKVTLDESTHNFKSSHHLFDGEVKVTTALQANDEATYNRTERTDVTTTVMARLGFTLSAMIEEADLSATLDATNCIAKADIVLPDGTVLVQNVPGVTLLGLERRIQDIKDLIAIAPTVKPGIAYVPATDIGEGILVTLYPKTTNITKAVSSVLTRAVATTHHQAVTDVIVDQVTVAHRVDTGYTGRLTAEQQHQLLVRTDAILAAVKDARQRANCAEVSDFKVMQPLTAYIMGK